jgi:glutathione synthase/RimK-type ligase-like ATP-grasp enzyme
VNRLAGVTARIALATAAEFPDLDDDGPALVSALASRGITAEPAVWTDPSVDYARYDLVVVRSTWDYHDRLDEFVDWADRVAATTTLANAAQVLVWNTDKTYLRELAAAGLPVVDTTWFDPGDTFIVPAAGEYVVKPAVSAGSRNTNRYVAGDDDDRATNHVRSLLDAGRTVMVQPYLDAIDTDGETALLFFGGQFSHAVRKAPLLELGMAFVTAAFKAESMQTREPSQAELAVAGRVLDAMPSTGAGVARADLLYARVDLVPSADGPVLLELELTEPSMYLILDGSQGADAADRFAAAIAARVDR